MRINNTPSPTPDDHRRFRQNLIALRTKKSREDRKFQKLLAQEIKAMVDGMVEECGALKKKVKEANLGAERWHHVAHHFAGFKSKEYGAEPTTKRILNINKELEDKITRLNKQLEKAKSIFESTHSGTPEWWVKRGKWLKELEGGDENN